MIYTSLRLEVVSQKYTGSQFWLEKTYYLVSWYIQPCPQAAKLQVVIERDESKTALKLVNLDSRSSEFRRKKQHILN